MQLPTSVRSTLPVPGYPVFEIDHPTCRARVALHGAHVMEWQPQGIDEPVLYLSPQAVMHEGKAIRGGVPICWPWFNAHPTDPSKPQHGIARNRFWTLDRAEESAAGVTLVFFMKESPWVAELVVQLGSTLGVTLISRNAGAGHEPVSGALHTYLSIGDIRSVVVEGLEDETYLDTVGERVTRKQHGVITIGSEVDRIFSSDHTVRVRDPSFGRTLIVEKSGSPSTVVWNPWIGKSAAIADLPDDAYRKFICIEAAIANEAAIMLKPGETHRLATLIRVEPQSENT